MNLPNPIIYINGSPIYENVIYNIKPLDFEETSKIVKVSFYMPQNHEGYENVFMKMFSDNNKDYDILYELLDEDVEILNVNKDESINILKELREKVEYYERLEGNYSLNLCLAISNQASE